MCARSCHFGRQRLQQYVNENGLSFPVETLLEDRSDSTAAPVAQPGRCRATTESVALVRAPLLSAHVEAKVAGSKPARGSTTSKFLVNEEVRLVCGARRSASEYQLLGQLAVLDIHSSSSPLVGEPLVSDLVAFNAPPQFAQFRASSSLSFNAFAAENAPRKASPHPTVFTTLNPHSERSIHGIRIVAFGPNTLNPSLPDFKIAVISGLIAKRRFAASSGSLTPVIYSTSASFRNR